MFVARVLAALCQPVGLAFDYTVPGFPVASSSGDSQDVPV